MDFDVLIIGAGIAGLSCGAILANSGYSVLILEKNNFLGGRCSCEEKDGFTVDFGLHIVRFGEKSSCAEVIRRINKKIEFLKFGSPLVYYEKKFWNFPNTFSTFLKVFLREKKFLSSETKLKFLKMFLAAPFTNPKKLTNSSLYDFIKKFSPTQEIIDIANLFSGIAFICPDIEKVAAIEVGEFFKKALLTRNHITYPEGGWKKILKLLEEEILKNGKILKKNEVKKIEIEGEEVVKVITQEREYKARVYISTVPFQEFSKIVDLKNFSKDFQKYIEKVEPTSGISLDFGVKKKISELNGLIITVQPLTIGCFISNIDESLTPKKMQMGNWFCYIPSEKINDSKYLKNEIYNFKNLLNEMFPDLQENLVWERLRIHKIVDGAIPKVGQTYRERPAVFSNIKNLFFAGDGIGVIGWGSEIAFNSAIKCGEFVKKYLI
jgi:phytoene dehydrogenase-like protein